MRTFFAILFSLLLFIFPREIRFVVPFWIVGIAVAITGDMQTTQSTKAGELETQESRARLMTAKAQNQLSALLDTLRSMESAELDTITGWDATSDLENIRAAIDAAMEVNESLYVL